MNLSGIARATQCSTNRIRVLVVDDSVVIRHLVQQALGEDRSLEVVGTASNGIAALEQIGRVHPDVVTLDIEMPEMDGLETLRQIRRRHPRLRTIMFSTRTSRGAAATFEALSLGADDYATKVSNAGSLHRSLDALRAELIPKIKQFFAVAPRSTAQSPPVATKPIRAITIHPKVLVVGVSTGGPQALAELLPRLPLNFPLPILIVQHMPAVFTRLLAERLDAASQIKVSESASAVPLCPGQALVAPGDHHLRLRRTAAGAVVTELDQGPHENSCRPSVDVLFRSVAEHYPRAALCVMLTGMGNDGLRGVQQLKEVGAYCVVQDEASSVVWGMPGAVARAGLADAVLPLNRIAEELTRLSAGNP